MGDTDNIIDFPNEDEKITTLYYVIGMRPAVYKTMGDFMPMGGVAYCFERKTFWKDPDLLRQITSLEHAIKINKEQFYNACVEVGVEPPHDFMKE